jgi:hypothetical protein
MASATTRNDIWDACICCSTCLGVGYGDIFARTPAEDHQPSAQTIGQLVRAALDGSARALKNCSRKCWNAQSHP